MKLRRPYLNLSLLGLGIVSACSLTVPSEDEVFGGGKAGSASAGAMSSAGTAGVGSTADAGNGGTPITSAGTGGTAPAGGTGTIVEGGAPAGADSGGAGGEPPAPKPTGEIVNPGFEQDLVGWTVDPVALKTNSSVPGKPTVFAQGAPNVTPTDGNFALSTWDMTKPYTVKVYQVVEGLEDGTYELSVQMSNKTGVKRAQLYAKDCGGKAVTPAPPPNTTSLVEVKIDAIEVVGGSCEIGIDIDAAAADWVNADSFKLTKLPPA